MTPRPRRTLPADLYASPLYLLAVLIAARRSKDRVLEGVTRKRLTSLGVRIVFADELDTGKAVAGGR